MSEMVPNGRSDPSEEGSASVKRRASISTFTPSISLNTLSRLQKVGDDDEYMFYPAKDFYTRKETEENCTIRMAMTEGHLKLLYLISKYGICSTNTGDEETWIREVPCHVLIYEGIVKEVFAFDYAPMSVQVSVSGGQRRLWMNISQEGKAATDDLREWHLLNGLKTTTADSLPITCIQLSERGADLTKLIPPDLKDPVDDLCYPEGAPHEYRYLLQCDFDAEEEAFFTFNEVPEGEAFHVKRESEVTETEDVSYVSSPWLPDFLRSKDRTNVMTSNVDQAYKSAEGNNSIDTELSEMFVTENMRALVTEWIPFGANQIVGLNDRLGALDRCQGGFFTNQVDDDPTASQLESNDAATNVKILDFDYIRFTNFEANINYAEEEGIIQIEFFGMHLNVSGNIIYGMEIEAIGSRQKDDISIDELSRLLVDVHQDSSQIMDDLLTPFQRILLDVVYSGDTANRPKYNMLLCDEIKPLLPEEDYIDRSERECELKQVLGDMLSADRLDDSHLLLLGRAGCLFAGPKAKNYDYMLVCYLQLMSLDTFLKCYFSRTFRTDVSITQCYELADVVSHDPNNLQALRSRLSLISKEIILLKAILDFMTVSWKNMVLPESEESRKSTEGYIEDPLRRKIEKILKIRNLHHDLGLRLTDLVKLINGADSKVQILTQTSNSLTRKAMADTVNSIDSNFGDLVSAAKADERGAIASEIMNIIFAGSFIMMLIDRFSGNDILGGNGTDGGYGAVLWVPAALMFELEIPYMHFILNMIWMGGLCVAMTKFMGYLLSQTLGAESYTVTSNTKVCLAKLQKYLNSLPSFVSYNADGTVGVGSTRAAICTMMWNEEDDKSFWGGEAPGIKIIVDAPNEWILTVRMNWNNRRQSHTGPELYHLFLCKLKDLDVSEEPPTTEETEGTQEKSQEQTKKPTGSTYLKARVSNLVGAFLFLGVVGFYIGGLITSVRSEHGVWMEWY